MINHDEAFPENTFIAINDKGEEVLCTILFTFDLEEESYVVYTDGSKDENGHIQVFTSMVNGVGELLPVANEIYPIVESTLHKIAELHEAT